MSFAFAFILQTTTVRAQFDKEVAYANQQENNVQSATPVAAASRFIPVQQPKVFTTANTYTDTVGGFSTTAHMGP